MNKNSQNKVTLTGSLQRGPKWSTKVDGHLIVVRTRDRHPSGRLRAGDHRVVLRHDCAYTGTKDGLAELAHGDIVCVEGWLRNVVGHYTVVMCENIARITDADLNGDGCNE